MTGFLRHGWELQPLERGAWGLSSPSTPLRAFSLFLGHLEVLKLLVARGADLGCKDRKGYGLLHTAAASGQIEVVKYLLRMGAEVRGPGTTGREVEVRVCVWRQKRAGMVGVVWGGRQDTVRRGE